MPGPIQEKFSDVINRGNNIDIFKLDEALKQGANPNYTKASSLYGKPLKIAIFKDQENVVKHLLNNWADATAPNENGETTVMLAVQEDKAHLIPILCRYNTTNEADANAQNKDGETALIKACKENKPDAVKALISTLVCDTSIKDNDGYSAEDYGLDDIIGIYDASLLTGYGPTAQYEKLQLDQELNPRTASTDDDEILVRQQQVSFEEAEQEIEYINSIDVSNVVIDKLRRQEAKKTDNSYVSASSAGFNQDEAAQKFELTTIGEADEESTEEMI